MSRSMHVAGFAHAAGWALVGLLFLPSGGTAQVRASERGGVWQTVDGTTIRVEYGRPAARGRDLFGGLVHWGEVWTPGANWATTLEVDRDVRVNDTPVAAGRYSVWLVPQREGEWTLGLDTRDGRFHTQRPDSASFAIRIPVTPGRGPHAERLTFEFDDFTRGGATLRMHWGETALPLDFRVRATVARPEMSEQEMAPYIGEYTLTIHGGGPPQTVPLRVYADAGRIRAGEAPMSFEFIPTDEPHTFWVGSLRDGEVFDIEEVRATFAIEDGRATGFTVPGIGVETWFEATRVR